MQDRYRTIEDLLLETAHLIENGANRQAYQCTCELRSMAEGTDLDSGVVARILVASARSAYYLSKFDESIGLLDRLARMEDAHQAGLLPADALMEADLIRADVLRRSGQYSEALECLDNRLDPRGTRVSARLTVHRLLTRGACLYYTGELEKSREAIETALGLATHEGDRKARSRVLIMSGLLNRAMGFMGKALDSFSRARESCRDQGDTYGEAAAVLDEAIVLYHQGRFGASDRKASAARTLFGRVEWDLGICRALILKGNIQRKTGDFTAASRLYAQAGYIADRKGLIRESAMVTELEGAISGARGDMRAALRMFGESLRSVAAIATCGDLAIDIRRRLGLAFLLQREYKESVVYLDRALADARKTGDRWGEGMVLRARGCVCARTGDVKSAGKYFKKSIKVLRAAGCTYELARTHVISALERLGLTDSPVSPSAFTSLDMEARGTREALKSLIEAGHLLSGTDDDILKAKVDHYIRELMDLSRRSRLMQVNRSEEGNIISIQGSDQVVIEGRLAGVSAKMREVAERIRFSASFEKPVLITGETGTGKELVARMIHERSERSDRPFIAVNCAAIPEHLFESEFFGHRKGCFTGATADRRGFFEEADGGTVFLDEIGELSLLQQVKLLRVLQEKKVRRVGENFERPASFRVISATNRDIEKMVADSKFREDLFYRINVDHIDLPSLRSRPEDITALLTWRLCGNGNGRPNYMEIEEDALRCMQDYRWPGNVRELLSVVDRLAHMKGSGPITIEMLPEKVRECTQGMKTCVDRSATHAGVEERLEEKLRRVMAACRGNKSAAARWLGISRGTLYKELRRAGLGHFIR